MNLKKIIAFCMIILSMFLQVSYAVGNSEQTNASSDKFRVRFSNIQYDISDEYGIANISVNIKNESAIDIIVNNIYPGIYYNINTILENVGSQSIKVTNINLISKTTEGLESNRLYDMIVGLNDENIKLKLNNYISFLNTKYIGKIIKSSESLAVDFSMGMDEDITDLENTSCEYELIINFEQAEADGGEENPEDPGNNGGDDDNSGGDNDNENTPGNGNNEDNKDKPVIDENDKLTDDINSDLKKNEEDSTQVSSDGGSIASNLSLIGVLPKSGEKSPLSMYIIALILMLTGIIILRKENKIKCNKISLFKKSWK